jgi:Asp-tRNA(Asn)/Glu-tRNA(Gln) amidotransferase A subunit family amidase
MRTVGSSLRRITAAALAFASLFAGSAAPGPTGAAAGGQPPSSDPFRLEEATIADIHAAIMRRELTTVDLVQSYLARIKAYDGVCVEQPEGVLGPVTPIAHAGQLNSLITLNLRPAQRVAWGFDERKARSMTDSVDNDPRMPDALEVAAALDAHFARTGQLAGPLHGVVFSIKDMLDTFDMRTTGGADAFYANDRPPRDSTVVERLRAAGAIILAKANMGEYASGSRSSFGGTMCNPYATDRDVGGSSGGSASSVAANLVTCSIGEEGAPSIRMPARLNNIVGLSHSQGLVSRHGSLAGMGMNDRHGPMCRTVVDTARVLTVIAGWDPADELTALSIGRTPAQPYESVIVDRATLSGNPRPLEGVRIGVVREYMDRRLFTEADAETIDIVERALADLRRIGATVVDPGPEGALFQDCIDRYVPIWRNALFIRQFPEQFAGSEDQLTTLLDFFSDPSRVPPGPTVRNFGPAAPAIGEARYKLNRYLRERGDANIQTMTDLINQANFYEDDVANNRFRDVRATLERDNSATTLDMRERLFDRFAIQQIVVQCMVDQGLDALVYPTGNVPPAIIKAPVEPDVNGRSHQAWTLLGQQGFPAISVPAGFTTHVYDRVRDPSAPGGSRLVGPVPSETPVGIDFLGLPFGEPTILRIASAYEAATQHRRPPAEFGPLPR